MDRRRLAPDFPASAIAFSPSWNAPLPRSGAALASPMGMISVSDEETATRKWDVGLFDRMVRDVRALPAFDASRPVKVAPVDGPNVFELPRTAADPPPPWVAAAPIPRKGPVPMKTTVVRKRPAREGGGSWLSVVVGAAVGAALMLVAVHPPARAPLERTFDRVVKLVKHPA